MKRKTSQKRTTKERNIASEFGAWKLHLEEPKEKPADQGREVGDWLFKPLRDFKEVLRAGSMRARAGDSAPIVLTSFKNLDCYITRDQQIGHYLQWLLALNLLASLCGIEAPDKLSPAILGQRFKKILFGDDPVEELTKDFGELFAVGVRAKRTPQFYANNPVLDCIIAALNRYLPKRFARLGIAEFLGVRTRRDNEYFNVERLDDFERFIIHGVLPPSESLGDLMAECLVLSDDPEDARRGLLKQTLGVLSKTDCAPRRAVVNVYGHDVWQGLRAFATEVLYSLKTGTAQPYRLVYLNVASLGERTELPGLRRIAHQLRVLCGIGSDAAGDRADLPFNLHTELEGVRIALTLYPTIIVVDGVDNSSGELVEIHDLIRNAQIADMLRVLLLPSSHIVQEQAAAGSTSFLVLSAAPVMKLEPWTVLSVALSKPLVPHAFRLLVTGDARFSEIREQRRNALGATLSSPSLQNLYAAGADDFDRFADHEAVGESDLVMLRLAAKAAGERKEYGKGKIDAATFFDEWLGLLQSECYWDALTLKFCVASVNGMRISTLRRVLTSWMHLIGDGQRRADPCFSGARVRVDDVFQASLAHFLDDLDDTAPQRPQLLNFHLRYPELIIERTDETVEALQREQRTFELQAFPDDCDEPSMDAANQRVLFDVRSETTRMRLAASAQRMHMRHGPFDLGDEEWQAINYLLAEESLSQVTCQFRNLHARALTGIYTQRRLVQAIMHGLLSLGKSRVATIEVGRKLAAPPSFALPLDPVLRYRFLYNFAYKRLLENAPDWSLSRGYGRPQLKCVLLKMFVDPVWAASRWRSGAVDGNRVAAGNSAHIRLDPNDYIHDAPAFHRELLFTLGYAALDADDFALVDRVLDKTNALLAVRPPQRAGDNPAELMRIALAALHAVHEPGTGGMPADESLNKITIELALARGENQRAAGLCTAWFKARLQRDYHLATDFAGDRRLKKYANLQQWDAGSKSKLDLLLATEAQQLLQQCSGDQQRKSIADALFRLAESRAVQADLPSGGDDVFASFLEAYAIYWIGDRVRIGDGAHGYSVTWHPPSAKPMRYWVRVCLKLAKTVRDADKDGWRSFYAHAKAITNVYTRHLHHLPRERIAMLLLQSSIARVWAELNLHTDPVNAEQDVGLDASLHYIEAAENLAIELGFPTKLLRRLFLERAKTVRRLAMLDSRRLKLVLAEKPGAAARIIQRRRARLIVAERDLTLLERICQGNAYWEMLVTRQREGLRQSVQTAGTVGGSALDPNRLGKGPA
jgi:hypothetical protein